MRKILKKVSASLILILMIFSVAFNVLTYATTILNNGNGTVTITSTSGRFKLILLEEMVSETSGGEYLTAAGWSQLLNRYDGYYSSLMSLTNYDPIQSNTSRDYITMDFTNAVLVGSTSSNPSAQTTRSTLTICLESGYVKNLTLSNDTMEFATLVHELCHLFQNKQDWSFGNEVTVLLEEAIILNGKQIISYKGETFSDILGYLSYRVNHSIDDTYKEYNEIAYKILSNTSISAVRQVIEQNNESTVNTNLERFEKFARTLNTISGKDISGIKLNSGNTIYQYMGGVKQSITDITTSVSKITVKGNNSNKDKTIDYTQGDTQATVTVEVKSDGQPRSVTITLGDKEQTITTSSKDGNIYTFTTTIDVSNSTTQQKLLKDQKVTVIVKDANGEEEIHEKALNVEDEKEEIEVEIIEMQVQQVDSDIEGEFDSDVSNQIRITLEVSGVEKKSDLSKITVSLKGFKTGEKTIDIDEESKTATVTIYMTKQEGVKLENKSIVGEVKLIVGEEILIENFDLEIIDEKKIEEIVVQYYDSKKKKYVTIDEDKKEIDIEIEKNDIYTFKIRIGGIEEEKDDIELNIGSTTVNLELNNKGFYKSSGIRLKDAGKYNAKVKISDKILREFTINLTVLEKQRENKKLVLYSDRINLTQEEGWDYGKTKSGSYTNHGINGADSFFIFIDRDNPKKAYFCFDHKLSLDPSDHYILYDAEKYTELEDEQKLILAFLAEVETFTDSSGRKWIFTNGTTEGGYDYGYPINRYAVQQFYIWKYVINEKETNAGELTTMINDLRKLQNNKNNYIDVNKGTITVNGETKKINLDTFKAIKYIPREELDLNNKTYKEGEELQPFFTYTYEIGDTTKIRLKKINEQGEGLKGATFTVEKRNEKEEWELISPKYTFTTDKEGLTDEIEIEEGEYLIYETEAPKGCKPTKQYVIITVKEDGTYEYTVYEASEENIGEDGYIVSAIGRPVTEELDWDLGEIEEGSEIGLQLEVINRFNTTDLELQLQKIDGSTGMPLSGVEFNVSIDDLGVNRPLSTGSNGNTEKIVIKKEQLKPGIYRGTIKETKKPNGYEPIAPINFTINISEDGTMYIGGASSNTASLSTNIVNNTFLATFVIKNIKEKEEDKPKDGVQFPLLMTISGKVWLDQPQGKNSEANGVYDSGDKLLQGIIVKLYESDGVTPAKFADKNKVLELINNGNNKKYLTDDLYQKLKDKAEKIPDPGEEIKTDEEGKFEISGLDPDKLYTVKFEYNGMRYSEIMASIDVEGCGTPKTIQTTAKAVENSARRAEITQMFSEIGPYPNNYSGGLVFTQTEVEKYEQTGELPQGVSSLQIDQFIEDTKIHAKIEGIGKILEQAESALLTYNSGLYPGIKSDFKFPVVKAEQSSRISYTAGEGAVQQWIDSLQILKGSVNVGYKIQAYECYERTKIEYEGHPSHSSHKEITPHIIYDALYKSYIKDIENSGSVYVPNQSAGTCGWKPPRPSNVPSDKWNPSSCGGPVGTAISHSPRHDEDSYWDCTRYYVDEGYSTGVEQSGNNWTRIATFDMENEPLYDYDKEAGKPGIEDGKWGWIKLVGEAYDDNKITTPQGKEGLGKLYNKLVEKIEELEPKEEDLCLVYRPTVDLGLYDDVQKAVVTINGQTETYVYDKRAANGGIFKFGVNQYDILNSNNNPKNIEQVEQAYADYYDKLSNGNPDSGENAVAERNYENIGIRKEDININMSGQGSVTTNGTAIAGGYNDYDVSIEMVYRIKIYNQSAVSARVTNILDYYLDTFRFDGVYSDKECTQKIADGTPTTGTSTSDANYNAVNINLGSLELKGNDSYEIFVKLHMTNPKQTLGEDVLDNGYTTFNYAEINGYGTKIGVIDIDSSPGDLRPENRFEPGPYDDDEGKSPTLIFKNPENASRKMTGIVFEDVDTGKLEIKSYTEQTRAGDGNYTQGSDKPVAGAVVELVEVKEDGTPYDSPTDIGPGVRAQTLTKEDGTYEFDKIVASNYILKFSYGGTYETVLTKRNQVNGLTLLNEKSYNGESYENTKENQAVYSGIYWYTNTTNGQSYAIDNVARRQVVTNNFAELTNEKAEILNSWKDQVPVMSLVDQLKERANMFAETKPMLLDVEYHPRYEQKIVETEDEGGYVKTYVMENLNFGIQERERAELQITKKVSKISIVDSAGREITGGKAGEDIKYVKWLQGPDGFLDMEIDKELLSGATLIITYEIQVANNSESGNTISNIQVIDYVSNNLNYDESYGTNRGNSWTPVTVDEVKQFVNNTSLDTDKEENKIDLSTYQTILKTEFNSLAPGKSQTKTLTLEKNLSSAEESDFNYANQVEIVQSYNSTGRGDYSSIYGNLDPETYTSRQGDLNWETINTKNENGYPQEITITADGVKGVENSNPAIRMAEKDSGNAEEVIITPPTGAKGIVLQNYHYIIALITLITTAGALILMKKYIKK